MAGYFRSSRLNCYTTLKVPEHPRGIHQNIWPVHLGRFCCCLLVIENASTLFSSFHFTSFPFCHAQLSNFHLHHTHSQSLPVCISPWLYIARTSVNTSTVSAWGVVYSYRFWRTDANFFSFSSPLLSFPAGWWASRVSYFASYVPVNSIELNCDITKQSESTLVSCEGQLGIVINAEVSAWSGHHIFPS